MKLENIFSNPLKSRLYCEWNVNFPKYFENRMCDDLTSSPNLKKQEEIVFLNNQNITTVIIEGFEAPTQFVMNAYEIKKLEKPVKTTQTTGYKTGSLRTFFIPEFNAFVKTHFSGRISSNYRDLRAKQIMPVLEANKHLLAVMKTSLWPERTAILPDYGAVFLEDIGCIYRSIQSYPRSYEAIIPLHSLFGIDNNERNDLPLFVQIANEKHITPTQFTLDQIIAPLIKSWYFFIFELHRKITCHGQNVLVGFNSNLQNMNIIHRDIQPEQYPENFSEKEIIQASRLYDFHMGWLLFDQIKSNNKQHINQEEFTEGIKSIYKQIVNKQLYQYEVRDTGVGLDKHTVLTNKKPKYR